MAPRSNRPWCPIHEYVRMECGAPCREARLEAQTVMHGYRQLWYERRREGARWVRSSARRRCLHCHEIYAPSQVTQKYCTPVCEKNARNQRAYDRRHLGVAA